MANYSFQFMELVEDYILEQVGVFINSVTELDVFLLNQPFPGSTKPSIGLGIMTYDDSGGWGNTPFTQDNRTITEMDLRFTIEIKAIAGRPTSVLAYLTQAFRGFQEARYQHLYSKGIGIINISNVDNIPTVFDGNETEQRARMIATFNIRLSALDIPLNPIEHISGSIFTNVDAASWEHISTRLYKFFNGDPSEGDTEEQKRLQHNTRRAVTQTFNVDFTTT